MGGNDIDIGESERCCLGLGLCVLRADFLRQLADGGEGAESSSSGLQSCCRILGSLDIHNYNLPEFIGRRRQ